MTNWQDFKRDYLIRFWSPTPALIAAGVLSAYYFGITGTYWAVTGEFTRWGGEVLQLFAITRKPGATSSSYTSMARRWIGSTG